MIFLTLEDETGTANVVVRRRVYETFRRAVVTGRLIRVRGRIERDGIVVHLVAEQVEDASHLLTMLGRPVMLPPGDGRVDEIGRPVSIDARSAARHPRKKAKRLFPSRDFH